MVRRDGIVAAMALVFGVAAAYESAKLPFGTVHNFGPGFFPWWISAVIVLLALILLVQAPAFGSSTVREVPGRIANVVTLLIVLGAYTFFHDSFGCPRC